MKCIASIFQEPDFFQQTYHDKIIIVPLSRLRVKLTESEVLMVFFKVAFRENSDASTPKCTEVNSQMNSVKLS